MEKRTVKIGDYNTAHFGWTVTGITLSAPEQKTNYVEKTVGDGAWDLSTVLTDGVPRYKNRTLTVTMELSTGDREAREKIINEMVNSLDGLEWPIVLPDRPDHYLTGRVHVAVNYSDLAHAAVTVTANCEPWFYSKRPRAYSFYQPNGSAGQVPVVLTNAGRKVLYPEIVVTKAGDLDTSLLILYTPKGATGAKQELLSPGTWKLLDFLLYPGDTDIKYAVRGGPCSATITYREAVLR